ncbi:zinc finger protein DHHC domain containing protein, putative [Entamoeba invadens IP1]|uniref:Palmitoyltransferase n=1 Tax=Entamoeba invadens IP1 TaxID=370355 RepID=A0A0A1UD95_ENTIV|nr:zinc finger protein DHHC domain containing protein, putative [Entamoeba invadens IP1]ELP94414.1 zinc finger protein DHHC domain containing protein, putative [Entamoeba invadens IP1]|eukprot:XP_004261185.1 zinc finger protein DHHC domain containing protein, putative [Entamoeba invadens IP1]
MPKKESLENFTQIREDLLKGPYLYRRKNSREDLSIKGTVMVKIATVLILFFFFHTLIAICFTPLVYVMVFPLTTFVFMMTAYYKVVNTHPGKCVGYEPNCSEEEKKKAIERANFCKERGFKLVDIGYPARYCVYCQAFRCERSYHCKKCDCCIMKRDHHCPWTGQCIGTYNLRYFIQFLMLLPSNALFGAIINITYMSKVFTSVMEQPTLFFGISVVVSLFAVVMMIAMGIAVFSLGVHHILLVLSNTTSMEEIEKDRYDCLSHDKAPVFPSYSLSKSSNWKEVMGSTVFEWFCPLFPSRFNPENIDHFTSLSTVEIN